MHQSKALVGFIQNMLFFNIKIVTPSPKTGVGLRIIKGRLKILFMKVNSSNYTKTVFTKLGELMDGNKKISKSPTIFVVYQK